MRPISIPFSFRRHTVTRMTRFLNSTEFQTLMYHASRMPVHRGDQIRMASRGPGRTAAVLLPLLLLFSASLLSADVIYLKNGRKLVAQVTREDDKQVFYEVSGGELALPKSMVDHIEKSDAPAAESRAGGARSGREIPPPLSALPDVNVEEGSAVIHDGAVDEAYIQESG